MVKETPKVVVTPLKSQPKILIVGHKNSLTLKVLKTLEKKGCQVFFHQKLTRELTKLDYIFQFSKFNQTKKLLEKAEEDQARYLLVEEGWGLTEERKKAEELVFAFKERVDGRILRIKKSPFSNIEVSTNQILKAMFGRKRPLILPAKLSIRKRERKKKPYPSLPKFKTLFFVLCFLFFVLSPYLFWGFNFFSGAKNLRLFEQSFLRADLVKAQESVTQAQKFFRRAKKTSSFLPFLKNGERMAFLGETLSQVGFSSIRISQISQRLARLVLGEEKGMIEERINQLKVELESLERQIFLAQALYQDLNLKDYQNITPFSLGEELERVSDTLSTAYKFCRLGKKTLPLTSAFLGLGKNQIYLVLFQNNMELRPGGGFIGSYGLAHFKEGVLTKFETQDVYAADGQLKGHVEPPMPIKKYLDQPHFFLRDSNFWPDFAQNAQKAAWFFKKEIGTDVDGVIAVDLSFAQKILEGLGGVYLPDYGQEITAENLFLKAETFTQAGFFPGSTQKRDFLGALARAILAQVKASKSWLKIAQGFKGALEEKHIQIFLFEKEGQILVEEMGWGGRIAKIKNQISNIKNYFPDYLMIVEANLGVNKANYFVKREIGLETSFDQEKVSHQLTILYQNTSPGKTFPGGVYKNYLRIFVPKEAVLERVEVKDRKLSIKEVETEEEEDKKSWGVLIEVEEGERGGVEFVYNLDFKKITTTSQFSYELFFQKQAGTEKDLLFLKFNYPKGWQAKKTNFPAFLKGGSFNFNSDLSVDRIFSIDF